MAGTSSGWVPDPNARAMVVHQGPQPAQNPVPTQDYYQPQQQQSHQPVLYGNQHSQQDPRYGYQAFPQGQMQGQLVPPQSQYTQPLSGSTSTGMALPQEAPAGYWQYPSNYQHQQAQPQTYQSPTNSTFPQGQQYQLQLPQPPPVPTTSGSAPAPGALAPSYGTYGTYLMLRQLSIPTAPPLFAHEVNIISPGIRMNISYEEGGQPFVARVSDMLIETLCQQLAGQDLDTHPYLMVRAAGSQKAMIRLHPSAHLFDALKRVKGHKNAYDLVVYRARKSARYLGLQTD